MALSEEQETIQLISFNIGLDLYGIDIMTIREILRDPVIEDLDKAPNFVDGVVRVRGEAIPVIDLKRRLGDSDTISQGDHLWMMITNIDSYVAGFMVDAVTHILKVGTDSIMNAPLLALEGVQRRYIRGVCESEMGMLVVLDFERLLSVDEISELNKTNPK